MKLWVTGLNHRSAPVEVRERLAFGESAISDALTGLSERPGVKEGLILSTCNRVEVAVAVSDESDARFSVETFLAERQGLALSWLQPYLYGFEGKEAVRHLFRVAASLDSMVIGEPQILGQLKAAYAVAKSGGFLSGYLDTVLTRAFSVAKRVRTETDIGASAVSISYAAVELAKEIFGSLRHQKVMLIGAGKMSELAARHLVRSGVSQVLVANRTQARAQELAEMVQGRTVPYESFRSYLKEADIVITSSGSPEYLLHKDEMKTVIEARRNRPMFLIDIAVPRNVAPDVNTLDNVFLFDIDDLQRVVETNVKGRLNEAEEADRIITEEVDRLEVSLKTRQVGPVIAGLQEQLEQIRQAEVDRMRGKLGPLSAQQELALESLTRGIINKIAHGPISELRSHAANPTGVPVVDLIRRVFRLREG